MRRPFVKLTFQSLACRSEIEMDGLRPTKPRLTSLIVWQSIRTSQPTA